MPMSKTEIAAVRHFTRFYTRRSEVLSEGLLASPFSLAEARVLYELAQRDGLTAADLTRELGLDPGYLSRMLKRLEGDGLVMRLPSREDGRRSLLRLTEAGRRAFAPLDRASESQVSAWLDPLTGAERRQLTDAMAAVEALLGRARDFSDPGVALRPHRVGDLGWIAHRQGLLYAAEYGWDATYEALVAEILAGFVREFDPKWEQAWIAERRGEVVGSVFLVRASDEIAKLRLLYVEPAARGLGLGARLVGECIASARARGYRTLTLWTNDCLTAARRLYEAAGFRLVAEERHHSFGQGLVGQNWALDL